MSDRDEWDSLAGKCRRLMESVDDDETVAALDRLAQTYDNRAEAATRAAERSLFSTE